MSTTPQTRADVRRWVASLPDLERERLASEARTRYPGLDRMDPATSYSLGVAMRSIATDRRDHQPSGEARYAGERPIPERSKG